MQDTGIGIPPEDLGAPGPALRADREPARQDPAGHGPGPGADQVAGRDARRRCSTCAARPARAPARQLHPCRCHQVSVGRWRGVLGGLLSPPDDHGLVGRACAAAARALAARLAAGGSRATPPARASSAAERRRLGRRIGVVGQRHLQQLGQVLLQPPGVQQRLRAPAAARPAARERRQRLGGVGAQRPALRRRGRAAGTGRRTRCRPGRRARASGPRSPAGGRSLAISARISRTSRAGGRGRAGRRRAASMAAGVRRRRPAAGPDHPRAGQGQELPGLGLAARNSPRRPAKLTATGPGVPEGRSCMSTS